MEHLTGEVSGEKRSQVLYAPAKLTLSLRVTGVRPDGFHLIDAEMITLDFGDELHISAGTGITLRPADVGVPSDAGGPDDAGVPSDVGVGVGAASIPLGPDNLVARALELLGRDAAVEITKRIAPGGGLGGGSADAAAVLRWGGFTDLVTAARLGADIAFCMIGGRARVRGIGELVTPLPFVARDLTLLTPPFGCNTAAVYRMWDELGGPAGANGNDLEPAALAVEPRLVEWRDRLGDSTGLEPRLAGSGSTWFVEGAHEVPGAVVTHAIE